ncbi:MAG TPA: WbqC family protein [Phycisphaerae bacterium]|nr:WbqC family protein [Phycisphaerales bacterium]HRX86544.1 WbqC family protein [Phycisphaerae bacterium]
MIVSIHQPAYLPWLGYFERIARSDVHVVLDHVQFEKNSFVNRNRVRTAEGACWLTVPVRTSGRFGALPIRELEIDGGSGWQKKHWRTIAQAYARAPYFAEHAAFFEGVFAQPWTHLAPLCEEIARYLLDAFGISTPRVFSSALPVAGAKDELVLNICRHLGAGTYLSGALGRDYLRVEAFADAGIDVVFQDYEHPVYPQGRGWFEPNLAAVDLLFHCGPASRDILMGRVAAEA